MARSRTGTASPEAAEGAPEAVSPEEGAAALEEAPAASPKPPTAKEDALPAQVSCRVKHGQLFAGAGVYHHKGDVLTLPREEAEGLVAIGVVEILK